MPKRSPMRLDAVGEVAEAPQPPTATAAKPTVSSAGPEPIVTIYARVPWSLGERLKDMARERSRMTGRRVTVNELVIEAIGKLDGNQSC